MTLKISDKTGFWKAQVNKTHEYWMGKYVKLTTYEDLLNNISDDSIYLRELIGREKKVGLSTQNQAHLGRLIIVFVYNSMKAYRDLIVREEGFNQKDSDWESFLFKTPFTPYFKRMVNHETVQLKSLKYTLEFIEAIRALQSFISHGLTDELANDTEKKLNSLKNLNLLNNPAKLAIDDIERILKFDFSFVNLLGMARTIRTYEKAK